MSFYSFRDVKAIRKIQRCEWCGEIIPAGSPARHSATVFEGDFQSGYKHMECAKAFGSMSRKQWEAVAWEGSWEPETFARGRKDDDRSLPPLFDEHGRSPDVGLYEI